MARNASFFSEYCNLAGGPLIIQRSMSFVSSSPSESELHARLVFLSRFLFLLFSARSNEDVNSFGFSGTRKDFSLVTSCLTRALLRSGTFNTAGSHFTEISVKLLHLSVKQNAVFSSVEKFNSFSWYFGICRRTLDTF